MSADITVLNHCMIVNNQQPNMVERAMRVADTHALDYDHDEEDKVVTIYGGKDKLWDCLHDLSASFIELVIE